MMFDNQLELNEAALIQSLQKLTQVNDLQFCLPFPHTRRDFDFGNKGQLPTLYLQTLGGYEWRLWLKCREISAKLRKLRIAQEVIILSENGQPFIPNHKMFKRKEMEMDEALQRLMDSGRSGGVVEYRTNCLVWATPQIHETAGRNLFDILKNSRNMSSTWDVEEEHRREQNLAEHRRLEDYVYEAYSWEKVKALWLPEQEQEPIWRRVKQTFRARAMYMSKIDDEWYRITEGVELIA